MTKPLMTCRFHILQPVCQKSKRSAHRYLLWILQRRKEVGCEVGKNSASRCEEFPIRRLTLSRLKKLAFQIDCFRKQHIVLEMDVLMKVMLKFLRPVIEGAKARTCIVRGRKVRARFPHLSEDVTGDIVLGHHHAHGVLNRAERGHPKRAAAVSVRKCGFLDVGKQNKLFLSHVRGQVLAKSVEKRAQLDEFRMSAAVLVADLFEQQCEPADLVARKDMVLLDDVVDQLVEGKFFGRVAALARAFEHFVNTCGKHRRVNARGRARLFQALPASAAVIDLEFFENPRGGGILERNIPDGGCLKVHWNVFRPPIFESQDATCEPIGSGLGSARRNTAVPSTRDFQNGCLKCRLLN